MEQLKLKYLFIRLDETGVVTQESCDLDEFKQFCHYASLSDWDQHKNTILSCLNNYTCYEFNGNDVWYYVLQHPTWLLDLN